MENEENKTSLECPLQYECETNFECNTAIELQHHFDAHHSTFLIKLSLIN